MMKSQKWLGIEANEVIESFDAKHSRPVIISVSDENSSISLSWRKQIQWKLLMRILQLFWNTISL